MAQITNEGLKELLIQTEKAAQDSRNDLKDLITANELRGAEYRATIGSWLLKFDVKMETITKVGADTNLEAKILNGRVTAHDSILIEIKEIQKKKQSDIELLLADRNFKKGGIWVVGVASSIFALLGSFGWFLIRKLFGIH